MITDSVMKGEDVHISFQNENSPIHCNYSFVINVLSLG